MKILFIISSLSSGGAERVLSLLANEFIKKNKITITTFSNEDSFYPLNNNIKHIKLNLLQNSSNIFESLFNSFKRIKILTNVIKNENPDIVISFMTHTNILSIIVSKMVGKKIIISERIAYDFYNSRLLNLARKFIYPFSNALITQTIEDKKNYSFLKNVYVIYNPIQINNHNINIKKENIILAIGRFDKQKGFDILIKVYSKIDTNWKLYIAGEGSERKNLENLIKDLNLENKVILLGRIKNIFKWYEKSSIFVLSSKKEGFPNVLIEAMAFGCAVMSFDCPYGPGEIIDDGVNGILIENQNKEKLKEAIEKLIEDENLREKLGKNALQVREKYSIDKIAKEWEGIIKEAVKE